MAQWLRLCASIAGDTGLVPGQGTRDHILGVWYPVRELETTSWVAWQKKKAHKSMRRKLVGCFSLAFEQDFFSECSERERVILCQRGIPVITKQKWGKRPQTLHVRSMLDI